MMEVVPVAESVVTALSFVMHLRRCTIKCGRLLSELASRYEFAYASRSLIMQNSTKECPSP
jgi:hypothetical protein